MARRTPAQRKEASCGRPRGGRRASSAHEAAARILEAVLAQQGTVKSLVMHEDSGIDKRLLLALVCESLKYREVIETIIEATGMLRTERKLRKPLAIVLVYDLMFGKGGLRDAGPFKPMLVRHRNRLNSELAIIKVRRKCRTNEELLPDHVRNAVVLPRHVRVNTIHTSVDHVVQHLVNDGFTEAPYEDMIKAKTVAPLRFCKDKHLPELVILSPKTDLHDSPLLLNGNIVLQDKASCFPAFVLKPPKGSVVIDACAAPGNKTSHLSAIMSNTGTIFAFDKSARRLETLVKLTQRAGCTNIHPEHSSFLDADPLDPKFQNVEYILLDPSCSGSGIVGRMDHLLKDPEEETDETESEQRIKALSDFQKQALLHAFKFPSVKRVVYSTCSIHRAENEDVVKYVLEKCPEFILASDAMPTWHRRGLPDFPESDKLIRALPEEDGTIGFFVALFERATSHLTQNDQTSAPAGKKKKNKNKKRKKGSHPDASQSDDRDDSNIGSVNMS